MLIAPDNTEPIPGEIYATADKLSRFSNICLRIISRISTIPPGFETLEIPIPAHYAFYRVCGRSEQPDPVNDISTSILSPPPCPLQLPSKTNGTPTDRPQADRSASRTALRQRSNFRGSSGNTTIGLEKMGDLRPMVSSQRLAPSTLCAQTGLQNGSDPPDAPFYRHPTST
jgi:hypothetical protein